MPLLLAHHAALDNNSSFCRLTAAPLLLLVQVELLSIKQDARGYQVKLVEG